MKSISVLLSAVLITAISIAAVAIVLFAGLPAIEKSKEALYLSEAKTVLTSIDNALRTVLSEGQGSSRAIPISASAGQYLFDSSAERIYFEMEQTSSAVERGIYKKEGNLYINTWADVNATDNSTDLILENSRLLVIINKTGSSSAYSLINTSSLIKMIRLKELSADLNLSDAQLYVNSVANTYSGTGYTSLSQAGEYLRESSAKAFIQTSGYQYEIHYTLRANADFLLIEVKNSNASIANYTVYFTAHIGTNKNNDILNVTVAETIGGGSSSIIWTSNGDFNRGTHTNTIASAGDLILESAINIYSNWTNVTPSPPNYVSPSARRLHAMSYDSQNNLTIMFGGTDITSKLSDTWTYNYTANNWTNVTPFGSGFVSPLKRSSHAMSYDSKNNLTIIFGGYVGTAFCDGSGTVYCNGTWTYNYTANNWTKMLPPTFPSARSKYAMSYDSQNNLTIIFGGEKNLAAVTDETWTYNYTANNWTNVTPSSSGYVSPSARISHTMSYDSKNNLTILFGGETSDGGTSLSDTWTYNYTANNWTQMSPPTAPSARYASSMSYDSKNNLIILFGGYGGSNCDGSGGFNCNGTWTYNYTANNWTKMSPPTFPLATGGHAMSYDSKNNLTIIFGGYNSTNYLNDTWIYNHSLSAQASFYLSGSYLSNITNTGTIASINATWNLTNASSNQNITIELSTDGTTWQLAQNNTAYTSGFGSGSNLRWRANFSTNDTNMTPYLHDLNLTYSYSSVGAPVSTSDLCLYDTTEYSSPLFLGLTSQSIISGSITNYTNDYKLALNSSNVKTYLAFSKGRCDVFRKHKPSIEAKTFLEALKAFSYPFNNTLQIILKYANVDILSNLQFGKGSYQLTFKNEGYNETTDKQKLSAKILK